MQFPSHLIEGVLLKRYKRFLADVELPDGQQITVHCANTGAMTGCADPGAKVWLWDSGNVKRKYPHSWELVATQQGQHLACINTSRPNQLVAEAVEQQHIEPLSGYATLKREVKYADNSRIDLLLSGGQQPDAYVEVKSVTLYMGEGLGAFPDAVSTRGQKHLDALVEVVEQGYRGVLLFCVPHTGIERVTSAEHIDPTYAEKLRDAIAAGVEVYAYGVAICPEQMQIDRALAVVDL